MLNCLIQENSSLRFQANLVPMGLWAICNTLNQIKYGPEIENFVIYTTYYVWNCELHSFCFIRTWDFGLSLRFLLNRFLILCSKIWEFEPQVLIKQVLIKQNECTTYAELQWSLGLSLFSLFLTLTAAGTVIYVWIWRANFRTLKGHLDTFQIKLNSDLCGRSF